MATEVQDPACAFGVWLRELRQARELAIREVAAAVGMDQALLSNIERGVRWPSEACSAAITRFLNAEPEEYRRRLETARLWRKHGGNPAFVAAIATQVHEDAAAFGVNKSAKKKK